MDGTKPGAKEWTIKEQIIDDPVSGLTIQFETLPDGRFAMRLFGDMKLVNNRDFSFSNGGEHDGSGTGCSGVCKPSWLTLVE